MMTTEELKVRVKELSKELSQLPDAERKAVIEETISIGIPPIDLCGLVLSPTALEKDIETILKRVRLDAKLSGFPGSNINVNEPFQVDVKVRNCTGHDLKNVIIYAYGTSYATLTSPNYVTLGNMPNAAPEVLATFKCKAIATTPASTPADTLLSLWIHCNVDLRGQRGEEVKGEILPN